MQTKQKSAFTMLEVAVVIVIIGVFVAGIVASNSLVTKFRITAAKNVTKASPIFAIKDNALWLETSLETSFNDIESNDASPLTTWYEQRNSVNRVFLQSVSGGPTYSNTINRVHAVKFTASGGYFTFDGSFLNGTDYTVVVLEKRESGNSGNYFLGDSSISAANQNLLLGYSASGQVVHGQGGSSSYPSSVSSYSQSASPRVFTFTHSATEGNKTYINGILAAEDASNKSHLSNISTVSLGKGYTGQIGELAIFTRALKTDEIVSVEDYIGQKWRVNINRANFPSCINGVVTDSGCDSSGSGGGSGGSSTCDVSVVGVSSTTPVSSGTGSLTCDGTNFDRNTISYTCSGGVLTTGSNCACASGYELSGANCVAVVLACTGGTITTVSGYKIHKFTSSGTFTCPSSRNVEVLVVGGGGGGSAGVNAAGGSGGGGGGLIYNNSFSVSTTPIIVTVGSGGAGATGSSNGSKGEDSEFGSLKAIGGGGGGARETNGSTGGSGGGGGISGAAKSGGAVEVSGQGFAGGNNSSSSPNYGGGGGGGAGSAGQAGTSTKGGNGGNGLQYNISGTAVYYAGGGASSYYTSGGTLGTAGLGGSAVGANGAANSGAGGGGALSNGMNGASGGSGVVIVRYSSGPPTTCDVAVTGVATPTSVAVGSSGNLFCNASGYNSSASVSYTCPSSGTLSVTGSCPAPILSYVVLTSGSSYTIQSGFTQAKIWAIGAGGGGGGAGGAGGGGGAGGVAYKTWSVTPGQNITYSIGAGGVGGASSGQTGVTGGNTTVTYNGTTITGFGGVGGRGDNVTASVGGSFGGGDGGVSGGGTVGVSGDTGGSSGAAIGGVNGVVGGTSGGTGVNSVDVSGLFAALAQVSGYPTISGGVAGGSGNNGGQTNHGFAATGFGCGGGGAGWWGGNGGNGLYGGGGGGAAGEGSARIGGTGGSGAVVIKFF